MTANTTGLFVRVRCDTVLAITDEIGTGGRLVVTDDTNYDEVRAWLESLYGTPEEIRAHLADDTDTAEDMLQAMEDTAKDIVGVASGSTGFYEYLGLSKEWVYADEVDEI